MAGHKALVAGATGVVGRYLLSAARTRPSTSPTATCCAGSSLVKTMADKGPVWERIVARHGLQPHRYEQIAGWAFGDFVFGSDYDIISDVGKARRAGFCESLDSERMFLDLFARFRAERIIP